MSYRPLFVVLCIMCTLLAMIPTPTLLIGYYHGLLMRDINIDQLMYKMYSSGLLTDQGQDFVSTGYSVYQKKYHLLDYPRCMDIKQLLIFCNLVQELCPEIGSQLKIGVGVLTCVIYVCFLINQKLCVAPPYVSWCPNRFSV